jgi:hypothetical protein
VSSEIINLTRAELYEKVWTTPMQKLAKEFGLSDVGLSKLCHRHEIPVPGRGYWARIRSGQTPGRVPLPALKETRLDAVHVFPSEPKTSRPIELVAGEVFPTIPVANQGPITHRVARRIEKSMAKSRADDRGLLFTRQGRIVPLKVTSEGLPRALRIHDALFAALDDTKHIVDWPSPYNTALKIVSDAEKLQFMMTETIERKEHKTYERGDRAAKVGRTVAAESMGLHSDWPPQVHSRVLRIYLRQPLMDRRKAAYARHLPR